MLLEEITKRIGSYVSSLTRLRKFSWRPWGRPGFTRRSLGMDGSTQASFGALNFGSVDLGDIRRTRRLVKLVDAMCRHPGGTLPDKLSKPPELRSFYSLMNREEVTHRVLMDAHTAVTKRKMAEEAAADPGIVFLRLHDATELDYTSKLSMAPELG